MTMTTTGRIGLKIIFVLIGIICIASSLYFTDAGAANWWQKGSEILKSVAPAQTQGTLIVDEIGSGLKDALRVGTENVVRQLGDKDGFNADPAIHIPLPENLQKVKVLLEKVRMSGLTDDLELKLNRAAEAATPKAKELFWQAITEMTFDDVRAVYNGPQDAATRYLEGKMSAPLAQEMRPVVETSLAEVGAVQSYDAVMGKYKSLPFVPDIKADLTGHVIDKGLAGIFLYLAKEEAAIRQDPARRTTDILKKVFGPK